MIYPERKDWPIMLLQRILSALVLLVLLSGCGHRIRYNLQAPEVVVADSVRSSQRILITTFADRRPPEERFYSARRELGQTDLTDYTYDTDFRGDIPREITKMIISHIDHAGIFAGGVLDRTFEAQGMSKGKLERLRSMGIDAVMIGEINSFYGYYDRNAKRRWLYRLPFLAALGLNAWHAGGQPAAYSTADAALLSLGFSMSHMESLHERHIERSVKLHARLLSTEDGQLLWQDTIEVSEIGHHSIPGIHLRANQDKRLAVESLRDAVNKLVMSLQEKLTPGPAQPEEPEEPAAGQPIVQRLRR